jgi:hypothetical protein
MRLFKAIARALVEVALYLAVIVGMYLVGVGLLLLGLRFWGAAI